MGRRYGVAAALAAAVTFGLFFAMQALITLPGRRAADELRSRLIEFVRLRKESEVRLKNRRLPEKNKLPDAPPPLPELSPATAGARSRAIENPIPVGDVPLELVGGLALGAAPSDSDAIPLVRVNPQYPVQALRQGIEGWVEVRFTISPAGAVKDAVIVASKPGSVFNRAALRAIRKWKYKPKIDNGVAVERVSVTVRLNFRIED